MMAWRIEEMRMDNGNTEEKLTLGSLFDGFGSFLLDGLLVGIVYYAQFPDLFIVTFFLRFPLLFLPL